MHVGEVEEMPKFDLHKVSGEQHCEQSLLDYGGIFHSISCIPARE